MQLVENSTFLFVSKYNIDILINKNICLLSMSMNDEINI